MEKWWHVDNNISKNKSTKIPRNEDNNEMVADRTLREWTFRVLVTKKVHPKEKMAITGDCYELGKWKSSRALLLHQTETDDNIWTAKVLIPNDTQIAYRYFVCSIDAATEEKHVRWWETHLHPRVVPENTDVNSCDDTFGDIAGVEKCDRGWLTTDTLIQFKFSDNPFRVREKLQNRLLYVKVTPTNLRLHAEARFSANIEDSESQSNDMRENAIDLAMYAFTEVVSLNGPKCELEGQPQFGVAYNPDDYLIFHVTVSEPQNIAYIVDLYAYSGNAKPGDAPQHVGYHYILPNLIIESAGTVEIPITCATKHRPLGMMTFDYLKITPLDGNEMSMKVSYTRYWNERWTGLDVGHRGSGTSFKTAEGSVIRENTIASLKKAAVHGADMVEFDVQLSKDLVPVIYHDFLICVSLKKKNAQDFTDMLELPMRELTLEQLKNLKVYHVVEARSGAPKFFDDDLAEHQPFPQLSDVLNEIDVHTGFNIEVKWGQTYKDGTKEVQHFQIDRNLYVDCILEVVLAYAGTRRIVFSCFDPDICAMLRFKQNIYPVMFLTQGVTTKWPNFLDIRCNTIEKAAQNACAMEFLGIVAHTEDLLRDSSQIKLTTDQGLILFCWGDDNNSKETIKYLKDMGLHAIIYDKMDVLSSKEVKESVFYVAARESQSQNEALRTLDVEVQNRRRNSVINV